MLRRALPHRDHVMRASVESRSRVLVLICVVGPAGCGSSSSSSSLSASTASTATTLCAPPAADAVASVQALGPAMVRSNGIFHTDRVESSVDSIWGYLVSSASATNAAIAAVNSRRLSSQA